MARRRINQVFDPVLSVAVSATRVERLVYILVANRPLRYGRDFSRIVYVGTTGRGVRRIASSASSRIARAVEEVRGLRRLDAYVVWARSRRGPQTKRGMNFWQVLERAILLRFKEKFGRVPILNGTGHNMRERHEFHVFRRSMVDRIINRFS